MADDVRIVDALGTHIADVATDGTLKTSASSSGNVASGTADSGNPVKVAGVYNTTQPTFTNGQRADAQSGARGAIKVQIDYPDAGIAVTGGVVGNDQANNFGLMTSAGQYVVNKTSGQVECVRTPVIYKTVAAVAITAGTGATIWTPAGGKKFRLMGWSLSATVGTSLIFGDNAVGTVILRTELLAAAGISQVPPGFGNGFLSAAANNVLKLDVTVGATVSGFVFGTEE